MKYRVFALIVGVGLIGFGVFALFNYWHISSPVSIGGFGDCPGCAPAPNSTGMEITYQKVIELNNSEPISVRAYIYKVEPSKFNCPKPLSTIESIDYKVQLLTAGVDVTPETIQTFKDNSIFTDLSFDDSSSEWTWIVYPKQPGTYTFHIRTTATTQECLLFDHSDTFQIKVVDIFGLTASQLRIAGFISGFLGSSLTLPGLVAIWAKLRENRTSAKNDDDRLSATTIVSTSSKRGSRKIKSKDNIKRGQ
jgi:hypothetical protein